MNKKEFLDLLEKKLSVLDNKEKQDIIIEYTNTINEKVKQGQTEEEAVKDFGDIDDLVKEILIAYKINPNYEEKTDSFSKKGEDLIKQGAEAVSDFSRKVAKKCNITSKDISLEFIVEIIIRIFIVLIAALVLKGVFTIFGNIGRAIFDNFYDPMGSLFTLFWNIILFAIYILICILMGVAIFKKYFKISENQNLQTENIKEENKPNNTKNTNKNIDKKQTKMPKQNKTSLGEICLLIVKIFVIIYVIIPFIVIDCIIALGLIYSIILLIKGINLIGLVLLLIGMSTLFTYLIKLLFSLLFGKGKANIIPVIISIILMIFGTIMFVDMVMNVDVIETKIDEKNTITQTKEFNTNKNIYIHYIAGPNQNKIDENMPDGKFTITLKYNKNKSDFKIEENQNYLMDDCDYKYENTHYEYEDEYEHYQECTQSTYFYLNIYDEANHGTFNEFKESYNQFIKDLKDNKFYYDNNSYLPEMIITANQKTLNMIKTNY